MRNAVAASDCRGVREQLRLMRHSRLGTPPSPSKGPGPYDRLEYAYMIESPASWSHS
ncbi:MULTISPECIES: hypothetical protein [unclassified Paraburkholderia]|uniref:hypothetical protein n=1 Tax=unclassified Paraburkholderia TaxID=2615204 RepID=UPI0017A0434A|nr:MULTISPECIES: hypothetical protein [unclassified Paraburkholderia]MBB5447350.1 hypothetical protein [Paraburkholderia sp. WSM4177]MBB5487890.1 hypothetical protein [Paraburkholderia sp. WSM4180]